MPASSDLSEISGGQLPPGWVVGQIQRPSTESTDALCRYPVTQIADAVGGSRVLAGEIRARGATNAVFGCAVTVWTSPGDLLYVLKAGDFIQPGDVLVIDGGGYEYGALFGDHFARALLAAGCRGVVIDGAARDVVQVEEMGLPIYSRYIYPTTRSMEGPGAINVPVSCGDVRIDPGDVMVCDSDGIVAVSRTAIADTLKAVEAIAEREKSWDTQLIAGKTFAEILDLDARIRNLPTTTTG